jgi:hypothetical protein
MISENDEGEVWRERAVMTWAVLGSTPFSILMWLLLSWVLITRPDVLMKLLTTPRPTPELIESTSIVRMEHRPVPIPQHPIAQPQPVQRRQAQPATKAPNRAEPTPESRPAEIARLVPNAPPQPTPARTVQKQASLSEMLAQQQAAFAKEAAQINAGNRAPISVATIDPNQEPVAHESYHMNFSGVPGFPNRGDGIITPQQSWRENGLDCYYGRYWYEYPDGHTESDTLPWAFCYPPRQDPFRLGIRRIPLPMPRPGYRLPAGTALTPIEKEAYDYWLSQQ